MSNKELAAIVREFKEYKRMRDEMDTELKRLQAQITAHMEAQGAEEMTVDVYKVSYKPVVSARLDTGALKRTKPEIFSQFSVTNVTRRFTVA